MPEKATGTVHGVTQPHTGEARIEVTDWRMPCYAQVRLRTEAGSLNFICLLEFRLGSAGEPNVCSHCYNVLHEEINYVSVFHNQVTARGLDLIVQSTSITPVKLKQKYGAINVMLGKYSLM